MRAAITLGFLLIIGGQAACGAPDDSDRRQVLGDLPLAHGRGLDPRGDVQRGDLSAVDPQTLQSLGAAACLAIGERDLYRLRAPTATYAVFGVLQYGALVRFADQVHWGRPATWAWLLLLASFVAMGAWGFVASRPPAAPAHLTANGASEDGPI